jgi:hypothetical protein
MEENVETASISAYPKFVSDLGLAGVKKFDTPKDPECKVL